MLQWRKNSLTNSRTAKLYLLPTSELSVAVATEFANTQACV